jgi:hypothetical protein
VNFIPHRKSAFSEKFPKKYEAVPTLTGIISISVARGDLKQFPNGAPRDALAAQWWDLLVINPTHDEIEFIRWLELRGGELTLQGSTKLLKIDRLIPRYVTHVSASGHTEVFTLTEKGSQLARLIERNFPPPNPVRGWRSARD